MHATMVSHLPSHVFILAEGLSSAAPARVRPHSKNTNDFKKTKRSRPHGPRGRLERFVLQFSFTPFVRVEVQRVRANILLVRPDHGASRSAHLAEVYFVFELLKHAEVQQMAAVVFTDFAILERNFESIAAFRSYVRHSRVHDSPQRVDLV